MFFSHRITYYNKLDWDTYTIRLAVSFVASTIKSQFIVIDADQSVICIYTILTSIDSEFFYHVHVKPIFCRSWLNYN